MLVASSTPSRSATRIATTAVLQPLLERQAHPEIRREAQSRGDLGGADLIQVHRGDHDLNLATAGLAQPGAPAAASSRAAEVLE